MTNRASPNPRDFPSHLRPQRQTMPSPSTPHATTPSVPQRRTVPLPACATTLSGPIRPTATFRAAPLRAIPAPRDCPLPPAPLRHAYPPPRPLPRQNPLDSGARGGVGWGCQREQAMRPDDLSDFREFPWAGKVRRTLLGSLPLGKPSGGTL